MDENAIIVKQLLKASAEQVWAAISQPEEMKEWYFDLPGFKAEKGYRFRFAGGPDADNMYWHNCEVLEARPYNLLKYSWAYEGYAGISFVSFQLMPVEDGYLLTLIHEGLDSFPADNPDLARENFVIGWKQIIGVSLPGYFEAK